MRRTALLFLFALSFSLMSFSQNNKYDELYIYVGNKSFIGASLGYKAYFNSSSKDSKFKFDNYYFKISYHTPDYQSLYSLGLPIKIETVNYIKPHIFFENMSNCEIHTELSLYKRIYIITDIPKSRIKEQNNKDKRHLIWSAPYVGTQKDIIHTNVGQGTFLDKKKW